MKILSQKEYCKVSKIGEKNAKKYIEEGTLPAFKTKTRVYIPENINISLELKEAKKQIRPECLTISIGNHKGGVLKTTNSQNIAASLAFMGYNVLLIDSDPQANCTKGYGIFKDKYNLETNNIIELLLDIESNISDEEYKNKIFNSIIKIERDFITGSLDILPNDPKMINKLKKLDNITNTENTLDYILSFVKNNYDFIIIDTPPRTDTILKIALMASDYFIISLKPEPYSSLGIPDIFQPLKEIRRAYKMRKNREIIVAGGIVADVGRSILHQANILQNKTDIEKLTNNQASIFNTFISHSEIVGESQYGDGAMMFTDFKHKVVGEYISLTNEIIEKILEFEAIKKSEK